MINMAAVHWSPLVLLLCACAWADIVMHNPRGSNNRLQEQTSTRNNANRLFNSQNNDRGGYNVGDATDEPFTTEDGQYNMKYFQSCEDGSKSFLEVEWTNQHGCGDINGEGGGAQRRYCDVVMQYMCQDDESSEDSLDELRNGVSRTTQPFANINNENQITKSQKTINVKPDRGLHETWDWYKQCYLREANGGLFVADQDLDQNKLGYTSAIYTRQNSDGARSAYECPEERDYWPYWQPTPWRDVAVLTSDTSRCGVYESTSFNSEKKGRCFEKKETRKMKRVTGYIEKLSKHINEESCVDGGGIWVLLSVYHEKATDIVNEAECTGKLGDTGLVYSWAIPYDATYNPLAGTSFDDSDSDSDEEGDQTAFQAECLVLPPAVDCQQADYSRMNHQGNTKDGQMLRYKWELPYFPSGNAKKCVFRMRYNISTFDYDPYTTDSNQNGDASPIQNNPTVDVVEETDHNLNLQIALNTAQYGRTFQDRSHVFKLLPREGEEMMGRTIYNLNVRGRRGNIVQTFPSVEYDFTPNDLKLTSEDLVHIQWTGSNTNPDDAGQGTARTDRSNLVPVNDPALNVPIVAADVASIWSSAQVVWTYFGKTDINLGDLYVNLASSGYYRCQNADSCTEDEHADFLLSTREAELQNELNNAPASYGGVVLRFTESGRYWFMCTRNNNFTNRAQKGGFTVNEPAIKRGAAKKSKAKTDLDEVVKRLLSALEN